MAFFRDSAWERARNGARNGEGRSAPLHHRACAIAADLQKQWQPGWSNVINGQVINNQIVAPDWADKSIAPHLDDRQRAEWKSWCEQAGGTRFGMHNAPVWPGQHGVDISGFKADPWWTP